VNDLPLAGILVVDASRMLPGAVLAKLLLDLGARVVKVEDPASGDPFRLAPPAVDGIGAGFRAFFAGAESVCLDLRDPEGASALRKLVKHADVFIESFRPGTLDRWDLGRTRLRALNPGLVACSLSGYGSRGDWAPRVGHDLNFTAQSGLLSLLDPSTRSRHGAATDPHGPSDDFEPASSLPRIQVADVSSGLLAASAILAALVSRSRTGIGADLDQPLALGPMPFLAWAMAESQGGGPSMIEMALSGRAPVYRLYACADGRRVALGAIEPKFWGSLMDAMGMPELAGDGLDPGDRGAAAAARVAAAIAAKPIEHWLGVARERNLPLTAVNDLASASQDPYYGGVAGAWLGSLPATSVRPVPRLGEHTERVLAEFGLVAC
jgi:crotonobetainyl-CoA:carnitine CoA-transferase CaiB-like acyl-CoA transferase